MAKVLVTGATGFVGSALVPALAAAGHRVVRAVRTDPAPGDLTVPDLCKWSPSSRELAGLDCIVHLAARTHVMDESVADSLARYRALNVEATLKLARAAVDCGVRRFVFMSSVKVNGERTFERPFTEQDAPRPEDAYGISKWEAEQALREAAAGSRMDVAVLRPPLIYGPGVKGNFLRLLRAVARGMPLPLASVRNRRSLLYLGNLVDAIVSCIDHPAAAGKTYLVADGADVSTPGLIRAIAGALSKPARLVPFPPPLLKAAAALLGKTETAARLIGSLQVDASCIRRELGWRPRCSLAQGLGQTAEWYYRQRAAEPRS